MNVKYHTKTSADAWRLMRAFDQASIVAGFPALRSPYTVEVRAEDRARADVVAFDGDVRLADYVVSTSVLP